MNLNKEYIQQMHKVAKAYDAEKDGTKRAALGAQLDALAEPLSDKQIDQAVKMLNRI